MCVQKTTIDNTATSTVSQAFILSGGMLMLQSFHFIFAALVKPYLLPSIAVFYILSLATIEVGLYLSFQGGIRFELLWRYFWFFLGLGLAIAFSANLNYAAVYYIDPGVAALLNQSEILFSLGFSLFWLKEKFSTRQGLGALIAIIGVVIVSYQSSDLLRFGSLLIIGSSFCYALHAALTKRFAGEMDLGSFFFFRLFVTAICMLGFHFIVSNTFSRSDTFSKMDEVIWMPSWQGGLMIFCAATIDVVLSRALYYATLRRLNLSIHTLVLTLAPVLTIIWSYLLFNHPPNLQQISGGIAVIGGVMLVTWRSSASPKAISHPSSTRS